MVSAGVRQANGGWLSVHALHRSTLVQADVLTAQQIEDAEGHTVALTGLCSAQGNKPVLEAMQVGVPIVGFDTTNDMTCRFTVNRVQGNRLVLEVSLAAHAG